MTWIPTEILEILVEGEHIGVSELAKFRDGVIRCDYLKILYDIIAESDAIGVSTQHIIKHPSYRDRCVLLPMEFPTLKTDYGIVTIKDRSPSPGIELVKKFILEVENNIAKVS